MLSDWTKILITYTSSVDEILVTQFCLNITLEILISVEIVTSKCSSSSSIFESPNLIGNCRFLREIFSKYAKKCAIFENKRTRSSVKNLIKSFVSEMSWFCVVGRNVCLCS